MTSVGADSLCRVCYERCTVNPTAATFLLSALWHGVYPGYYLTFLTGIAVTMAARSVSAPQRFRPEQLQPDGQIFLQVTWELK